MSECRETEQPYDVLEQVSCEMCGSVHHEVMIVEDAYLAPNMRLVRCNRCGLAFTNPRPTEKALEYVYSAENYVAHTASAAYCLTGEASRGQFLSALDVLRPTIKDDVHLLDVGCGTGHFLSLASRVKGWEVTGVEPSEYAAERASRQLGSPVHVGELEAVGFPSDSFDIVTLWYVLEHAAHPKALLREVGRVLRPKGIVVMSVPNLHYLLTKRAALRLVKMGEGMLHLDEHLFHYTPKTLVKLLEVTGFSPIVHGVAEPFIRGDGTIAVLKRLAFLGFRAAFRLTGKNIGGIFMCARKKSAVL